MKNIANLVNTMLTLVGLYLVLRFGANASKLIGALARGGATLFKTLQARD